MLGSFLVPEGSLLAGGSPVQEGGTQKSGAGGCPPVLVGELPAAEVPEALIPPSSNFVTRPTSSTPEYTITDDYTCVYCSIKCSKAMIAAC